MNQVVLCGLIKMKSTLKVLFRSLLSPKVWTDDICPDISPPESMNDAGLKRDCSVTKQTPFRLLTAWKASRRPARTSRPGRKRLH